LDRGNRAHHHSLGHTKLGSRTVFAPLFFCVAPGIALLLLWRGITRARRETHRRKGIALATLAALGLWVVASDFMLDGIFETAWGLAHTRSLPEGFFPEGWLIYGFLTAYSGLGATLVWTLGKLPRKQMTM
jgi:hypothetical protein